MNSNIQSLLSINALTTSKKWGDILMEEDYRFKYMTEEEWLAYVQQELNHPVIDVSVLEHVLERDAERRGYAAFAAWVSRSSAPVPIPRKKQDLQFRLWKDMFTEPSKYGEDLDELPSLEVKVGKTYWGPEMLKVKERAELLEKVRELVEKFRLEYEEKKKAAIRIQAAVRGHQCRTSTVCRFRDCCHCLAHTTCELQVGWRYWVCKDCVRELTQAE
jgi:hypothetical protein